MWARVCALLSELTAREGGVFWLGAGVCAVMRVLIMRERICSA